jgi:hypothetical protein
LEMAPKITPPPNFKFKSFFHKKVSHLQYLHLCPYFMRLNMMNKGNFVLQHTIDLKTPNAIDHIIFHSNIQLLRLMWLMLKIFN